MGKRWALGSWLRRRACIQLLVVLLTGTVTQSDGARLLGNFRSQELFTVLSLAQVTILFCDIVSFTTMCQQIKPQVKNHGAVQERAQQQTVMLGFGCCTVCMCETGVRVWTGM